MDVTLVGWNAFYVPKGTPEDVVTTLNRAANEALKDDEVKRRFSPRWHPSRSGARRRICRQ